MSGAARARIDPAKLLKEFLPTMEDAETALDLSFGVLLLLSWKKVAIHGSLSFQMDLPVTSRKVSRALILTHTLPLR